LRAFFIGARTERDAAGGRVAREGVGREENEDEAEAKRRGHEMEKVRSFSYQPSRRPANVHFRSARA
jgi:hypothetical protein